MWLMDSSESEREKIVTFIKLLINNSLTNYNFIIVGTENCSLSTFIQRANQTWGNIKGQWNYRQRLLWSINQAKINEYHYSLRFHLILNTYKLYVWAGIWQIIRIWEGIIVSFFSNKFTCWNVHFLHFWLGKIQAIQ